MRIHVQQFQSIADASIVAEGFTAVTGPSNRGKSALLRAIAAALFNRPGDDFVRLGASVARVTLTEVPDAEQRPRAITWTKGKGANQFVIDGETFDKVGTGAPDLMPMLGFRDLWIGDAARGRGEALRPQVAQQFDGLFLLGRTGSFIADVVARISRVLVLQRAHGRASADLKAEKALRTVRARDLVVAESALDKLAPIADLVTRVDALGVLVQAVRVQEAMMQRVQGLTAVRAQVLRLTAQTLPTPVPLPGFIADIGGRLRAIRARIDRRAGLVRQLARPLPAALRAPQVDAMQAYVTTLRGIVRQRASAVSEVYTATHAVRAARDEEALAREAWALCFAALKVCPLCERAL